MAGNRLKALTDWCNEQLSNNSGTLQPLASEASTRRFYRIETQSKKNSYIAMDSPPETEDNQQFVRLSEVFRKNGVTVPKVYEADLDRGFLLVEDFGDRLFFTEYPHTDRKALIMNAVALMSRIQLVTSPSIPPYEESRYRMELEIFREWTCEALLNIDDFPVSDATDYIIGEILKQPCTVIHRDFHCKNLFSVYGLKHSPNCMSEPEIGIVDFQDALLGAFTYDLASYTYDCYWEFSEEEIEYCIELAWTRFGPSQREEYGGIQGFHAMVEIVALQRMLKAVGIFCRLHLQRNRASHLPFVCSVLERAAKLAFKREETGAFGSWLQQTVRPAARARIGELGLQ